MAFLTVEETDWAHPDAVALRRAMYDDLAALYPAETAAAEAAGGFDALDSRTAGRILVTVVARVDGRPAGCGSVARLDAPPSSQAGVGELKKVFVRPDARRAGVARGLLDALEAAAQERGLTALLLETGVRQGPAIRLYEDAGYEPVAPFAPHGPDPTSVFLGKRLG
ncbi:MAG TPA: GNAT family N-acetyltransferase [Actinotalea sp.]